MIRGNSIAECDPIKAELAKLDKMNVLFYLTGSRYFGSKNPNDYDFFVEFTENTHSDLLSNGYSTIAAPITYVDQQVVCVLRKFVGKTHFDIQLVQCAELKEKAQRIIYARFHSFHERMSKLQRNLLWNFAFHLLKNPHHTKYDGGPSEMKDTEYPEFGANMI